jgi:Flp pilus assembly pilin Flp
MFVRWRSLCRAKSGSALLEYALVLGLVAIAGIFGIALLGSSSAHALVAADRSVNAAAPAAATTNAPGTDRPKR